jgi:hypothetical protein
MLNFVFIVINVIELIVIFINYICAFFSLCSVFFIFFPQSRVLSFVCMSCAICVLFLIVVPLSPSKNPFAIKINNNTQRRQIRYYVINIISYEVPRMLPAPLLFRQFFLNMCYLLQTQCRVKCYILVLILGVCILLRVWDEGGSVFRPRNFNIVGFLLFI